MKRFKNYAGLDRGVDNEIKQELIEAGIPFHVNGDIIDHSAEVQTRVAGFLHGWFFIRAWRYWVAKGPGLPPDVAMRLYKAHGKEVRVEGHACGPDPLSHNHGFAVGMYHVDTQEGLKALADILKSVYVLPEEVASLESHLDSVVGMLNTLAPPDVMSGLYEGLGKLQEWMREHGMEPGEC